MPVIEHPTEEVNPLHNSALVVLRIDPVASVAPLGDDEATRKAVVLSPKKVLAIYHGAIDMEYAPELGGLRMNASFRLAGRGLPSPPFTAAAIPIAPAQASTDTGRAALQTTPVFPLDDCYVYTLKGLTATVCRLYQEASSGYQLGSDDDMDYRLAVIRDGREFASIQMAAETSSDAGSDPVLPLEPQLDRASRSSKDTDVLDVFPHLIRPDNAKQMRLSVEMWLRTSPEDELTTPDEFDAAVNQLRKIEREWAHRLISQALSKEPQTNAWLDGVDNVGADGERPPEIEPASEPTYPDELDDLVRPEDAIEHRVPHEPARSGAECTAAVIENPTHEVNPVKAGTFVLIQVDPIASVAELDDEQATREAATLTLKRVLALYDAAINMEYSAALGGLRMNASFRLAGHGRPPPPFAAAAVPISPAPAMFDPDRNPLRTSQVLPWDDCYLYTLEAVTATVSRIHQHSVPGFQVAREEKRVYRLAVIEDSDAFAKLGSSREAWYTNEPDSTGSVVPQDDDGAPSNTGTEVVDVFPYLFQPDDARRMRLSVEMWLGASATDELASPRDFDATVQALKRIEREWANRFISKSLAKTPETNAWLEGVAGANEPVPPPESEHSYIDELDDLVQPEDAIEHRIAQTVVPPISSENRLTDPSRDSSNHVAETGNPPLEELQAGSQTLAHAGVLEPEAPASVESEAPMGHEAGARSDIDGPKSTEKPRKQRVVTRYLSRPLSFIQHVTARIRALPR